MSDRMKKSFLYIPATVDSASYDRVINSEVFYKINEAACDSTHRNNKIATSISVLLSRCRPPAVGRFVVAALVRPAINAFPFGFLAHILKKLLKRLTPSCANSNPTTAVKVKVFILWILTAVNHGNPTIIRRCFASAMRSASVAGQFAAKATTRFCSTPRQGCINYKFFTAAITPAKKPTVALAGWTDFRSGFGEDNKPSKSLSDEVYSSRHCIGSFSALFSGGFPATTGTHCDYEPSYAGVN